MERERVLKADHRRLLRFLEISGAPIPMTRKEEST